MRLVIEPAGPLAFDVVDEEKGERLGRVHLPLETEKRVRATFVDEHGRHRVAHDTQSGTVRVGGARYFVRRRGPGLEIRDRWRRVGRARITSRRTGALRIEVPDHFSRAAAVQLALLAHIDLCQQHRTSRCGGGAQRR